MVHHVSPCKNTTHEHSAASRAKAASSAMPRGTSLRQSVGKSMFADLARVKNIFKPGQNHEP